MEEKPDKKRPSKLLFIVTGILILSTVFVLWYVARKPKKESPLSPQAASAITLMPENITTAGGAAQSFTVTYSEDKGWENISEASLYISAGDGKRDQWPRYNPKTKRFTLTGAKDSCTAGQATRLSTDYLILNCGASSASISEPRATIIFSLTPKPSLSGTRYRLFAGFASLRGTGSGKLAGTWTISR